MVTVETLSIVFTGLSISLAAFYYISTLRNAQKTRDLSLKAQEQALETRQAQMFMQIYNESHNNPSYLEALARCLELEIHSYLEFLKAQENEDDRKAIARIGMFYEGLGVLVKEGYVSIRLVALLMTGPTQLWWERIYKSWIEEGREKMNYRRYRSEAEYLYNELMRYVEEHPELKM